MIRTHTPLLETQQITGDIRHAKGCFLNSGASGILEILPSGDVIKSPWPGQNGVESRKELSTENKIYCKLGPHSRLVRTIDWNSYDCSLTMEYMPQGDLQSFLLKNPTVTETQRLRWAKEAAEGLQLLHDADVLHCDVNPKNFLLDTNLGLKIADFGGSSLEGSKPAACSGQRFSIPDKDWLDPPTVQDDLFALGTTIYFIMTGQLPFPELREDKVEENYRNRRFPDISEITCGRLIEECWKLQITSAQHIYTSLQSMT
ncbi:hypothetical protein WAI453_013334 [Rhynchosporium graminicola]|uniref:Protein kinase domain-containing protein n=1 Tax=Rhynchosporium graminicola TaxID=2792576 RepID=A0A1E1K958_9HELO|nr:uncharacterized protein RCO7_06640 [Rhynchosporium commune]